MDIEQLETVISRITKRDENLFFNDVQSHQATISKKIEGKSALVIGGAGSIGSSFINEIIKFKLKRLYVVDTNENGLAELVRDIRSSGNDHELEIMTYPISFSSKIFEKLFIEKGPFEIVANFAAHKHVRSEKDEYAIQAMFENNFINANRLLKLLQHNKPEYFFCVSTDKATNPVSIMGATKSLMEEIIFSYKEQFNVSTARFANVAFSNGSLLDSYINRFEKKQPIVCPSDITRYFVSPKEAGSLCLLACMLGSSGDIFIPKLTPEDLIPFTNTVVEFFKAQKIKIDYCESEAQALNKAKQISNSKRAPYPVYLFKSDTSGEKLYEEFYDDSDEIDWDSLKSVGIIKEQKKKKLDVDGLLTDAEHLFDKDFNKSSILNFLSKHVPGFSYEDKGKCLDQRM